MWARDGQDASALWARLHRQKWTRRCMRCGGDDHLDLAVVCSCASAHWSGCLRYHTRCCDVRPVRRDCVVTLARCWLCRKWVMALAGGRQNGRQ